MKKFLNTADQSASAIKLANIESLIDIELYVDSLYKMLYTERNDFTLANNMIIFSNPTVRFTVSRHELSSNPCVILVPHFP